MNTMSRQKGAVKQGQYQWLLWNKSTVHAIPDTATWLTVQHQQSLRIRAI